MVDSETVELKNCYFYLLYKRKGDETTQIPIDMNDAQHRSYDSETDTITVSFEPDSYFTNKSGSVDIQVFACQSTQDFSTEDVNIENVAAWTTFNTQITVAKSQLQDSQTIISEDLFTKEIDVLASFMDKTEEFSSDAEEFASDAEEFAKGQRSDGLTVPHASTGAHDNAKDYKDLAKDWASKIGGAVESGEYSAKYYAVVSDTRSQESEAYALGTKGGTPVPAFADKNSKDWATKTGSTVDGTNYSSKQYALYSKDYADIVSAHATAIDAIGDDLTNIDAVATDILDDDSAIDTVATNIADVTAVAGNETNIITVAGKATEITTVAGIASNVTTVAGISSDVTAVAGIASDVSAVEDIKTDVSAVASIDSDVSAVATIASDVSAVADIDDDVTTVATNVSDVSAVADDITNVNAVADDLTNIDAVAGDLTNIDNAEANALKAEGWANGTQNGTPVSSDSPYYENNAKYWCDAVPDLKNAIDKNTARIENLEQKAGDYSTVQYRGTNAVPTGKAKNALVESIVGKTREMNNIFDPTKFVASKTENGVTFTNNGDGTITLSGTASAEAKFSLGEQLRVINGDSYILGSGVAVSGVYLSNSYTSALKVEGVAYDYKTSDYTANATFYITVDSGTVISTPITAKPMFRNLELTFPEGVPNSLAGCLAKCPDLLKYDDLFADGGNGYSLVDTTVEGVEARGFNLWDEVTELGKLNDVTGADEANSAMIRSKNYTEVSPLETYYVKMPNPSTDAMGLFFYDADKNFVSSRTVNTPNGLTFSVPTNAKYIRFYMSASYGTSYGNDICINISGSLNGTYKPYVAHSTLSLSSPVTLRSAGSVADTDELNVEVNGVAKRRQTTRVGTDTVAVYSIYERSTNPNCNFALFQMQEFMKTWSNTMVAGCSISSDGWDSVSKEGELLIYDTGSRVIAISIGKSVTLADAQATYNGRAIRFDLTTESVTLSDPVINNTLPTEAGGTINTQQTQSPVIDNCLDVGYLAL